MPDDLQADVFSAGDTPAPGVDLVDGPGSADEDSAPGGTPSDPSQGRRRDRTELAVTVVIVVALVVGASLRVWFLFNVPVSSDEAVAGLMAHHFLQGHANAFFWGQPFGGVEPWLVAGAFAVAGQSTWTLSLLPVVLSAVAAVLVWRVTRRFVADPRIAALAGAMAWATPLAFVYQSTVEGGYRGAVLICGLAVLLFSLRMLDGRGHYLEFVGLGVFAGVGWWALPESVYLFLPAGLILIGAIVTSTVGDKAWWWARHLGVAIASFVVADSPWLWDNLRSGFASLQSGKFPGATGPENHGFRSRLSIFFHSALPLQLNLRRVLSGIWLVNGPSRLHTVAMYLLSAGVIVIVVGALVLCGLRGGRAWALVAALVAFPILVALQPGTWDWLGGRYEVYLGPILAIAVATAVAELAHRLTRPAAHSASLATSQSGENRLARGIFAVLVVGALITTMVDFHLSWNGSFANYFKAWGNPNQAAISTAAQLEAKGVKYGYGDYWLAYKLDFVSGEHLNITTIAPDPDRWLGQHAAVARSPHAAWLFVPVDHLAAAYVEFGATPNLQGPGVGPNGSPFVESAFVAKLDSLGIPYRIVKAGDVDAIFPSRSVTPAEVGLTG